MDEVDYYIGKCLNYDVLNKRPTYRQSALYKDISREIGYWLMEFSLDTTKKNIVKLSLPRKEEIGDSLNSLKLMYMSQEIAGKLFQLLHLYNFFPRLSFHQFSVFLSFY